MNVGHRTGLSWSFSFWGKGFGLERQDCGLYLFCAGSLTGLDSSAEHRSPGVERADPQGPSSLPIVRHRWSASTSFVLAALRALHVDPSYAVTKSAMIEEGTSSHWTWHFARTYRTPPSGRGNYGPGSLNRPTFMPGGPNVEGWRVSDGSFKCTRCKAQTAVTAGTLFDRRHRRLSLASGALEAAVR